MYYNMSSIRGSILSHSHSLVHNLCSAKHNTPPRYNAPLLGSYFNFKKPFWIYSKTEFWKEELNFLQIYCSDNPSKHLFIHVSI